MKLRVNLGTWTSVDGRTREGRVARALRKDFLAAYGAAPTPRQRVLVDMVIVAKMTLDDLDLTLAAEKSLVRRGRPHPLLSVRNRTADHLARLLEQLESARSGGKKANDAVPPASVDSLTASIIARRGKT
jgi:hypothetical protein